MERDVRAGLAAARERTEQLLRQATDAQAVAVEPVEGTDGTGSVSVILLADGTVTDLYLDPGWRELVGVDGLGAAIVAAAGAAAGRRLENWAEAFGAADPAPAEPAAPAAHAEPAPAPSGSLTEAVAMLHELNDTIDAIAGDLQRTLAAAHAGRSRPGHVTATVSGARQLVSVGYDHRWLVNASDHNVVRETTEAIAAGFERAGRLGADLLAAAARPGDDPLRTLRALRNREVRP